MLPKLPRSCACLLAAALLAAPPAFAQLPEATMQQSLTDTELLETLFNEDEWGEELFTPDFLAQVPLADLQALIAQLRDTIGTPVTVTGAAGQFQAETATHIVGVQLTRDAQGRVAGLFYSAPDDIARTTADILADLDALAPEVAWLVTREGEVVHEQNADEPLAVGSAFKLGVMKAVQDAVNAGSLGWNDLYMLADRHRSLPTGILQNFPEDAPLTLHTLVALMISQSDNTATDLLMQVTGRAAVEAALGSFPLRTREFFVLKAEPELREAYLEALEAGDDDARTSVINQIAETPLPGVAEVLLPHMEGIEWYVPLETLCTLAGDVANNDVFSINPGPIRAADWQLVAYKGGSEIGVLNLTANMVAPSGEAWCAAVTLNAEEAIDQNAAIALYGALTARLAAQAAEAAETPQEDEAEPEEEAEESEEEDGEGEEATSEEEPAEA